MASHVEPSPLSRFIPCLVNLILTGPDRVTLAGRARLLAARRLALYAPMLSTQTHQIDAGFRLQIETSLSLLERKRLCGTCHGERWN